MFVLRGILRAESQEKILIYLYLREKGYGKTIAEFYGVSQNAIQKQLARMEQDSLLVSGLIGKVRQYQLNPQYAFMEQLKTLLKSAIDVYPPAIIKELLIRRMRPRKAGKPTIRVQND